MLPLIELIIDENIESDGIEAISLVHTPAIEENFVALSSQKVELKTLDEEKRIVVSLALIPDKEIYRRDSKGKEYNIVFSKDTVRKASELYFKNLNNNNATLEHEEKTDGVSVIESWIIEDVAQDKTALYGLNAVEGAWAVVMKIDNDEVWADIKEGKELQMQAGWHAEDEYVMTDLATPKVPKLSIMVKIKDDLGGRITNRGSCRKDLSTSDYRKLSDGFGHARKILKNAGVKHVSKSMVFAAHPGGTVKIGDVVDSNLKTERDNLYVCDCSVIPEAWGLPPTLTVLGLGKRLSKHLLKDPA